MINDSLSKAKVKRHLHDLYEIPEDRLVFVYLGLFVSGRGIEKLLDVFSNQKINSFE
jgi:hypothetical protein